jgi:tetratricopeptide (TPR) repeat protein
MNEPIVNLPTEKHLFIRGFLGYTSSGESLRELVPIIGEMNGGSGVVWDQGKSVLSVDELHSLCTNGELTLIAPAIPFVPDFRLAVGVDPSSTPTSDTDVKYQIEASCREVLQPLWLFYASTNTLALISDQIATRAVRTALGYFEAAEFDFAANACSLGARRSRRHLEAEALLWATQSIQRPEDSRPTKYEQLLLEEVEKNGRSDDRQRGMGSSTAIQLVVNLFEKRGISAILSGLDGENIRLVNDANGNSLAEITFLTKGTVALHGFARGAKLEPKQPKNTLVNTCLLLTWQSIYEHLRCAEKASIEKFTNITRNFWRLVVECVLTRRLAHSYEWLDECRITCWREGVGQRSQGNPKAANDLFLASAHIATGFIKINPNEPLNFFQRAQCYETLGFNFQNLMKADLEKGLKLRARPIKMSQPSYVYLYQTSIANAYRLLARLETAQEHWAEAISHYRRAITEFAAWLSNLKGRLFVHERYSQCLLDLGCLTGETQMIEEALATLEALCEETEGIDSGSMPKVRFDQGWLQKGDCYFALGRLEDAEKCYRVFVNRRPHAYTGYDRLRLVHLWSNDEEHFRDDIRSLAEIARARSDVVGMERARALAGKYSNTEMFSSLGENVGLIDSNLYNLYLDAAREGEPVTKYKKLILAEAHDPLYISLEPFILEAVDDICEAA